MQQNISSGAVEMQQRRQRRQRWWTGGSEIRRGRQRWLMLHMIFQESADAAVEASEVPGEVEVEEAVEVMEAEEELEASEVVGGGERRKCFTP